MRHLLPALITSASLLLAGCASQRPQNYLNHYGIKPPTVADFEIGQTIGCKRTSELSYSTEEWAKITACFQPKPADAAAEREAIQKVIALMEQINGPKNDTYRDNPRNAIIGAKGNQLDCVAEAVNSTVGLLLLEQEGLLQFHTVGYPQHRGFAQLKLPHNTASIIEKTTKDHYVVDSWYGKNGEEPDIQLVNEWRGGIL
ncbi:MAG: hypothetical protein AAGC73_02460 [Verrucomicrobiota bacterium]